jgi:hypothetical protein
VDGPHAALCSSQFANSILTGAPQLNATLEDGIACVKAMVAAAYSSLHGAQWIDIESVGGDVANPYLRGRELAAVG